MKILWVKSGKLLPLDTGGKLRTYNLLRHLSTIHDVTYLSYYGGNPDETYEREILRHLPGTISVNTAIPEPIGLRRHFDYLRHLLSTAPYAVGRFTSVRVQGLIAELVAQRRFEVAVCDFLASSQNFPRRLATPSVLFQHNVESMLWLRRAQFGASWADRIVSKFECAKMVRYEAAQVRRFHRVLAVSEPDRFALSRTVDSSRIGVVPTGVDLAKYRYDPALLPLGPLVVFTGSMDWEPNIDGVEQFCKLIWPQVQERIPEARFRIVGRNPHIRVQKLASASVEVSGTVPSIVEHLRAAAVLVVPLRIGGGTRIKIYEGMAIGKATVSTLVGAEGLDVQHERDILLTDHPERFAEYIVSLLGDETMRRRYEAAAAATAGKYDWSVVTTRLAKEIEKAILYAAASFDDTQNLLQKNPL